MTNIVECLQQHVDKVRNVPRKPGYVTALEYLGQEDPNILDLLMEPEESLAADTHRATAIAVQTGALSVPVQCPVIGSTLAFHPLVWRLVYE